MACLHCGMSTSGWTFLGVPCVAPVVDILIDLTGKKFVEIASKAKVRKRVMSNKHGSLLSATWRLPIRKAR